LSEKPWPSDDFQLYPSKICKQSSFKIHISPLFEKVFLKYLLCLKKLNLDKSSTFYFENQEGEKLQFYMKFKAISSAPAAIKT